MLLNSANLCCELRTFDGNQVIMWGRGVTQVPLGCQSLAKYKRIGRFRAAGLDREIGPAPLCRVVDLEVVNVVRFVRSSHSALRLLCCWSQFFLVATYSRWPGPQRRTKGRGVRHALAGTGLAPGKFLRRYPGGERPSIRCNPGPDRVYKDPYTVFVEPAARKLREMS